ncbi:MAG: hypothetical protein KDB61_05615 [Planctomycetes bacterium]|nr:hypothetical protein [Planctomycetota bacterium]
MNPTQAHSATRESGTRALTLVWLVLIGFSLLNYYLAENWLEGNRLMHAVLAASLVKLLLVTGAFMELWSVGRGYFCIATGVFVVTIGCIALIW